ncbi:phospholipase D-like domain-containing protein [Variovorax sp. Sphag1AA]|uniref:phospholipase D-like domain-containing protein n=1 Tax=Variovorax sp. Sphag1AA TaxID=2587027 RepID=UPI0021A2A332|nr:phospholipase D-like domain-containing protein [Variovorax sp. Sphag1AA]
MLGSPVNHDGVIAMSSRSGYLEYRRDMVEMGVDLYELSPTLARSERRLGQFGTTYAALHMKTIVFDRKSVFLGSMNLDGRSEQYNTEVGVMIRSEALAREIISLMDFESSSYRVVVGPEGQLKWVNRRAGHNSIYLSEPEAEINRKIGAALLGLLIPHDWL